jgi:hypothetical protein
MYAQLDELDKAIGAAEKDPKRFQTNLAEVQRRKAWTLATRAEVYLKSHVSS